MTSMERVVAALQGTEVDRRAFTMTLSLYGAKLTGCPLTEYYTSPEKYLRGQIAVYDQCRPDILFTPFALALEAQAFGSELVYLQKSPPNIKKAFIRNVGEIEKTKVPDIGGNEGLLYLRSSARLLADRFKGEVPICGVLTSPLDLPAIIMGVENWLEILLFDREKSAAVIALMSEYFVSMANNMFDSGVNFIAVPMMFSNPKLVFEKVVREIIAPALAEIFSKLKGPVIFHHGGNPIAGCLPLYCNIPNIAGFCLDPHDDFDEARKNVGVSTLLLGNLDGPRLGLVTTAHALETTKKILDNRKDDRHFIFATSSADVAWDTPIETITGIHDLIQHYGSSYV